MVGTAPGIAAHCWAVVWLSIRLPSDLISTVEPDGVLCTEDAGDVVIVDMAGSERDRVVVGGGGGRHCG